MPTSSAKEDPHLVTIRTLEQLSDTFHRTGVISYPAAVTPIFTEANVKRYIKALERFHKKDAIILDTGRITEYDPTILDWKHRTTVVDTYYEIRIRNLVRNLPLIAPLKLAAQPGKPTTWHQKPPGYQPDGKHLRMLHGSNYTFYFIGTEEKKILDAWLAETQTNPAMRKALKLPPITPQLKEAA